MGHKTLTISEEAYNALKKLKKGGESFSDVILRITKGASLLEYIESTEFSEDLAESIEEVYKSRESDGLPRNGLSDSIAEERSKGYSNLTRLQPNSLYHLRTNFRRT